MVKTPTWKKYLSDNQFEDGYLRGNNLLKFFDDLLLKKNPIGNAIAVFGHASWTAWSFTPPYLIQDTTTYAPTSLDVPWT